MTKLSPSTDGKPLKAADRIRRTAQDLFYRQGIRAVGVDEIVTQAGVTKPSLYRSFASKDELAAAYLVEYDREFWQRFDKGQAKYPNDPRAQLLDYLRGLGERAAVDAPQIRDDMDTSHSESAATHRRVLVVEDTLDIRELLVDLLEGEGYRVTACTNGQEALDLLTHDGFDVVLLDLMMPVMDGLQLLQTLRTKGVLPPPIIAMSAFERFRHTACELGAAAFIGKPVDIDHLLDAVASQAGEPTVH